MGQAADMSTSFQTICSISGAGDPGLVIQKALAEEDRDQRIWLMSLDGELAKRRTEQGDELPCIIWHALHLLR